MKNTDVFETNWTELCPKSSKEPDEIDRKRAEYIVDRMNRMDVLPGGTYEPALKSYLALYLADVRRAGTKGDKSLPSSSHRSDSFVEQSLCAPSAEAALLGLTERVKRIEFALENCITFNVGSENFFVTIFKTRLPSEKAWRAIRTHVNGHSYSIDHSRFFASLWDALAGATAWLEEPKA